MNMFRAVSEMDIYVREWGFPCELFCNMGLIFVLSCDCEIMNISYSCNMGILYFDDIAASIANIYVK